MSTTKIKERHLDDSLLDNIYTKTNPPTASDVGALPLDGSVYMTGKKLKLFGGYGGIEVYDTNAVLRSSKVQTSDTTSKSIRLWSSSKDLPYSLELIDSANGVAESYLLYGEHNTDLLANTIKSLIDSGVISMSAVKSVQRGVYTHTSSDNASITINAVDSTKCVVILDSKLSSAVPATASNGSVNCAYKSTLVSITNTKLTISSNYFSYYNPNIQQSADTYGVTSWQVVEYA